MTVASPTDQDLEYLRLLSIFHYVAAGIVGLFACLPLVHLFLGLAMVAGWGMVGREGDFPAAVVGGCFITVSAVLLVLGWGLAVCLLLSGRFLAQRRHYTFCIVVAAIACTLMPFGTLLGALTIALLSQYPVKQLFGQMPPEPAPPNPAPESPYQS